MPPPPKRSRARPAPGSTMHRAARRSSANSPTCTTSFARTPPSVPPMPSRKSSGRRETLRWDRTALVAGVDEAGRGPLAGPVVAAAVILDELAPIEGLADSKALGPRRRERLFDEIRAKALASSIAEASVAEIDRLNILEATLLAMRRAVERLRLPPRLVLVDRSEERRVG